MNTRFFARCEQIFRSSISTPKFRGRDAGIFLREYVKNAADCRVNGFHLGLRRRTKATAAKAPMPSRISVEGSGTVVGPTASQDLSGIVSFASSTKDLAAAYERLARAGIVTSLRRQRGGTRCLRLSAHFYSREADVAAALEAL